MKKLATSIYSGVIVSLVPMIAMAADNPANTNTANTVFKQQTLPKGGENQLVTVAGWMKTVVDWIFTALLIAAVIMIIVAAFRYLFSGGDEQKITKANRSLLYAAVAIAVGLLAQAFVFIIAQITGNPLR